MTLWEERKLRVFENMVLRRIFGPRRDEVTVSKQMCAVQTQTFTFHKKMVFVTCKLLAPGKGL